MAHGKDISNPLIADSLLKTMIRAATFYMFYLSLLFENSVDFYHSRFTNITDIVKILICVDAGHDNIITSSTMATLHVSDSKGLDTGSEIPSQIKTYGWFRSTI